MSIFARSGESSGAVIAAEDAYERHKDRARRRSKQKTRESQEIGPLPPVKNPERRAKALESLLACCETYFAHRFGLPWASFHYEYMEDLERIILRGGYQATALMRGGGKTTIAECGMLWGRLKGIVPFGVLIGANQRASDRILKSLRRECEHNELLLEDFPEIFYPIHELEGTNQKRLFLDGNPIEVRITKESILFPEALGTGCAGGVLYSVPLTGGGIRGMKYTKQSGENIRPTHVIVDDAQTKKSASSDKMCREREEIIKNDILGLSGPGKKLAVAMPCTIIRKGDLADRFLNRKENPDWHGRRHGALRALPKQMELWQQYWEIRSDGLNQDDEGRAGNEFYAANRAAMDEGAESLWPDRFNHDETSAIQNFMNFYLPNPSGALAEYQNDPPDPFASTEHQLEPEQVVTRVTGYDRGIVPPRVEYVSAGVDLQGALLYWVVLGSETDPTSHVLDYSTWPQQRVGYFHLRDATRTIQKEFPDRDQSAQLYAALEILEADLFSRTYKRADGAEFRVGRLVVDTRWETATVFKWASQSPNRDRILPAQGLHRTQLNFDRAPREGTKFGPTMDYMLKPPGARPVRSILLDSASWISRIVRMLSTPVGSAGAMTLFNAQPQRHRMFAEHCCAEYSIVKTDERTKKQVVDWKLRPGVIDNHFLDATKLALLGNFEQGLRESFDKPRPSKRGGWGNLMEGDE